MQIWEVGNDNSCANLDVSLTYLQCAPVSGAQPTRHADLFAQILRPLGLGWLYRCLYLSLEMIDKCVSEPTSETKSS